MSCSDKATSEHLADLHLFRMKRKRVQCSCLELTTGDWTNLVLCALLVPAATCKKAASHSPTSDMNWQACMRMGRNRAWGRLPGCLSYVLASWSNGPGEAVGGRRPATPVSVSPLPSSRPYTAACPGHLLLFQGGTSSISGCNTWKADNRCVSKTRKNGEEEQEPCCPVSEMSIDMPSSMAAPAACM